MKRELLQIRIDGPTLNAVKAVAESNNEVTVSQFVREAVREKLSRVKAQRKGKPLAKVAA